MSTKQRLLPGEQPAKRKGTRLIGFAVLITYMVAVSAVGTQLLAAHFGYSPRLGSPLFAHVYKPWAVFEWVTHFYNLAPDFFGKVCVYLILAWGVGLPLYVITVGILSRSPTEHHGIHGTAHWATKDEIIDAGLLARDRTRWERFTRADHPAHRGVYVGGWEDDKGRLRYLRHDTNENVGVNGPPGSGKGVAIVVPTLLSWPHSVVVNDQKNELWNLSAGWRREAVGPVLQFNPEKPDDTCGINPLSEIRIGTMYEVGDAQNIAVMLVDPDGEGLNTHWTKTAYGLFQGLILHMLYVERIKGRVGTLPDLARMLSDPTRAADLLWDEMLENKHLNGMQHPTVASAARDMMNTPEEERGSIISTARSYLYLYADPVVAHAVSFNSFRITDLMNAEKPLSLYLCVSAEQKDRMRPLMRLILNQIVRVLLRPELIFKDGRQVSPHLHRMLLLLEEFPAFGKMQVIQEALAYLRGHGIKSMLVWQDTSQVKNLYGNDESITSSCDIISAFAPNKFETAKWLSDMSGVKTVITEDTTVSGKRLSLMLDGASTHKHAGSRALITPDEVQRLKSPKVNTIDGVPRIVEAGDMLIFRRGHSPIFGTQPLYFRDPIFLERSKIDPPAPGTASVEPREETVTPFTVDADAVVNGAHAVGSAGGAEAGSASATPYIVPASRGAAA